MTLEMCWKRCSIDRETFEHLRLKHLLSVFLMHKLLFKFETVSNSFVSFRSRLFSAWSYHEWARFSRFCKNLTFSYRCDVEALDNFLRQTQKQVSQAAEENNRKFSSHQDFTFNDNLWLNDVVYQQLSLRFNQINQNLTLTNATCNDLQIELLTKKEKLTKIKHQHAIIDASLKHEFKCHRVTKKSLEHERNVTRKLMNFINNFELSKCMKTSLLSKEFQLDVLFRENQNMRQKIFNNSHELDELRYILKRKKNHIDQLNAEKKRAMKELDKQIKNLKSEFLNYMSKDDNISIETTMIEKRRRASLSELKKIL